MVERIPFLSPTFPPVEEVAADYAAIVESGIYSNGGSFDRRFAQALGNWMRSDVSVSLVASGTAGLQLAIAATFVRGRTSALVASFTFAAGPLALRWSGFEPAFLDIDRESWQPSLEDAEAFLEAQAENTAGILLTNTFGVANQNIQAWESLAQRFGVPLVVDSAAGFGSQYPSGESLGARGTCEVFSLHATKTLPVGEGGAVTSRNHDLISRIDRLKNFGFGENRDPTIPGTNAKLPELSCAIGLRQLAMLDKRLEIRRGIYHDYREQLAGTEIEFQLLSEASAVPFVSGLLPSSVRRDATMRALEESGVEVRKYYNPPVQVQSGFELSLRASPTMAATTDIASRIISLPMSDKLTPSDVKRVAVVVRDELRRS